MLIDMLKMKKYLYLSAAVVLMLTSCSKDDSTNTTNTTNAPSTILPKTIKHTFPYNSSRNYVETITYNGNKIVSIDDGLDKKTVYTYTGNLITKVVTTFASSTNLILFEYTYEGTNVKSLLVTEHEESWVNKTRYEYYKNYNVYIENYELFSRQTYIINSDGSETGLRETKYYTFVNGNLAENRKSGYLDCFCDYTFTYEHDTKNNPFNRIIGFNKLLNCDNPHIYYFYGQCVNTNNVVKSTYIDKSGKPNIITYTYEYNNNNYPIKLTSSDGDEIIEYTY